MRVTFFGLLLCASSFSSSAQVEEWNVIESHGKCVELSAMSEKATEFINAKSPNDLVNNYIASGYAAQMVDLRLIILADYPNMTKEEIGTLPPSGKSYLIEVDGQYIWMLIDKPYCKLMLR